MIMNKISKSTLLEQITVCFLILLALLGKYNCSDGVNCTLGVITNLRNDNTYCAPAGDFPYLFECPTARCGSPPTGLACHKVDYHRKTADVPSMNGYRAEVKCSLKYIFNRGRAECADKDGEEYDCEGIREITTCSGCIEVRTKQKRQGKRNKRRDKRENNDNNNGNSTKEAQQNISNTHNSTTSENTGGLLNIINLQNILNLNNTINLKGQKNENESKSNTKFNQSQQAIKHNNRTKSSQNISHPHNSENNQTSHNTSSTSNNSSSPKIDNSRNSENNQTSHNTSSTRNNSSSPKIENFHNISNASSSPSIRASNLNTTDSNNTSIRQITDANENSGSTDITSLTNPKIENDSLEMNRNQIKMAPGADDQEDFGPIDKDDDHVFDEGIWTGITVVDVPESQFFKSGIKKGWKSNTDWRKRNLFSRF